MISLAYRFFTGNRQPATGNLLLLLAVCLLTGCKNNLEEAKLVTSRANVNIEQGKGVIINYSDHGKTKIKADAKTITRFNTDKPYMEFSDGIKVSFYSTDGQVSTTMVADYASAVENSNVMTASKNVEVINAKGEKLNTEELIWDEQKKILYSNAFVKISTADEIIYGNGMQANEDFTDYVIKKITGKVKVKTEKE
ncbi:MAG: hypothetical protein JWO03_712 [Bacteroidetes bacterium]|nr:hypothetical protein [Bacteroidota bacterium]